MPVSFDMSWRYLSGLHLANSEFVVPGYIDVLVCVNMFSRLVNQGRRQGRPGFPKAMKTCFGWVLTGTVGQNGRQDRAVSYVLSVLASDEKLEKPGEARSMIGCLLRPLDRLSWSTGKFAGLRTPNSYTPCIAS